MLLLVGQVERAMLGRGAFQEVDYDAFFAPLAKRAVTLRDAQRTPEVIGAAVAHALSGRPGPVVVALPEDVLSEHSPPAIATAFEPPVTAPAPSAVARLSDFLAVAQRPMIVVGGPGWTDQACNEVAEAAERLRVPIVASWRRKDLVDNAHAMFAGELGLGINPALLERVKAADLLIVIGARLSENPTQGYTVPAPPVPAQPMVWMHPDPEILGGVYRPALAIQSSVAFAARALLEIAHVAHGQADTAWSAEARAEYEEWSRPTTVKAGVNMAAVVAHMSETLPPDAIWANGAGNFSAWVHRFHQHRRRGTQLAPTSGAMGYGFPAALAAKLVHPNREVVCVAGDGDFLMSAHELATAVRYEANFVTVVVDNGQYGTIAMHQARAYPGRAYGTALTNPDFAALAESYGAFGQRVDRTEAFPDAFAAARDCGRPAVIACRTDPAEIAPGRRLD